MQTLAEAQRARHDLPARRGSSALAVSPLVRSALTSPGRPLDERTRSTMERRLGHDFSAIRVHDDAVAGASARSVGATAYTLGRHVVFQPGLYNPGSSAGRNLLAHELVHSVQQGGVEPNLVQEAPVAPLARGGHRVTVAPGVYGESSAQESEARAAAEGSSVGPSRVRTAHAGPAIMRVRVPVPSTPLCGRTLTHIDIEPPRARPLVPCLPPTVMVTRINLVGRDLSVPTPGRGPQVFNLHIGYYVDPSTGRFCAIADDSKRCLIGRCVMLGCFPTLQEVIDAILAFLKTLLKILGIIILAIIIALILRGFRGGPAPAPTPALAEGSPGRNETHAYGARPGSESSGGSQDEEVRG